MAAKFDLSSVKPEAAEWKSGVDESSNPAIAWLRESYETGSARQVPVPAAQVRSVVSLFQQAARVTKLGMKLRIVLDGTEYVPVKETLDAIEKHGNKRVHVKYLGKVLTPRPRKNKSETPESA